MNTHHAFADSPFQTIDAAQTEQVTGGAAGRWLGLASQIVGMVGQNVQSPRAQGILGMVSKGLGMGAQAAGG
jgi:hypothetical protein